MPRRRNFASVVILDFDSSNLDIVSLLEISQFMPARCSKRPSVQLASKLDVRGVRPRQGGLDDGID